MGETSAKDPEDGHAEDVIFNGASDRPSKNFCEVTLKLENDNKNKLSKIEEIEVKRKLEKDKGSKYFLNTAVRQRKCCILFYQIYLRDHILHLVKSSQIGNLITLNYRSSNFRRGGRYRGAAC